MNDRNDSLLEIATSLMKRKKKPQTLDSILAETFQKKGIAEADDNVIAQFEVDFMLSGTFIYCGEDKNGNQLWDLKERQPSSLLDKDGGYLEDLYADDEDVIKNELKDDFTSYNDKNLDDFINDDDVDSHEDEEDDIQEELGLVADDAVSEDVAADSLRDEEDEEFEDFEEEEEDDIEAALRDYNK